MDADKTQLILINESQNGYFLDKICAYANSCQDAFEFTETASESGIPLRLVDALEPGAFFDADETGAALSVQLVEPARRVVWMAAREYFAVVAATAGLHVATLRRNPEMIAEDLYPPHHLPCVLSNTADEFEQLIVLEQQKLCASCTEFYEALGMQQEVQGLKQILEHNYRRRRDRSYVRRVRIVPPQPSSQRSV